MDLGGLIFEDVSSFADCNVKEFSKKTSTNICSVFKALFELKAKQDAKHGEDGEILENDRSEFNVKMPNSHIILPREKACPKEEQMTKWEKFREERGLPPRKKRGRLVFDPIQNDWVPRWGKGSIKKLAEGDNWLMHEKPKHVQVGLNPFDYAKDESKRKLEKQNLAELRNKLHKKGGQKAEVEMNDKKAAGAQGANVVPTHSMKLKENADRNNIRKREAKSLMKSLKLAQKSTASMGQFDKKLKKEPEADKTQKIAKKKSNKGLHELESNRASEKNRNMKVLDIMDRKR